MKKIVSMILICCILAWLLPASSVKTSAAVPSIEDILSDYHEKAFEAQFSGASGSAVTYSRSAGVSGKTLEQESVDTLTAAGYEAYNVTANNYDTLEESLQTDFAEMGLDPEGSYIVVISGEDTDSTNSNARIGSLPEMEQDDQFSDSSFIYTYDGTTYLMRYVTVTATTNSQHRQIDYVNINEKLSPNKVLEIIGMASSVVGLLSGTVIVGGIETSLVTLNTPVSISLLLLDLLPDYTPKSTDLVRMTGCSVWTVKYTQIYNFDEEQWCLNAGVEYATVQKYIDYDIYNPSTFLYDNKRVYYDNEVIYSSMYNDPEMMKQIAVLAYNYGQGDNRYLDKVDKVHFKYGDNGRTVMTLCRTIYDHID